MSHPPLPRKRSIRAEDCGCHHPAGKLSPTSDRLQGPTRLRGRGTPRPDGVDDQRTQRRLHIAPRPSLPASLCAPMHMQWPCTACIASGQAHVYVIWIAMLCCVALIDVEHSRRAPTVSQSHAVFE